MSETKRLLRIIQPIQIKIISGSLLIIKIQANPKPKRMQTEQLPMPNRRKQIRQKRLLQQQLPLPIKSHNWMINVAEMLQSTNVQSRFDHTT